VLIGPATWADWKPDVQPAEWYLENYVFSKHARYHYTFESEFDWPDGYDRIDSTALSDFQYWISNVPLWYADKGSSNRFRIVYAPDAICRSVHLPWRTISFYDWLIPVQLMFEYFLSRNAADRFAFAPKEGDSLRYDWFLEMTAYTYRGRELRYRPGERRADSDDERNVFVNLCYKHLDIPTLIGNCAAVSPDSLLPGDLMIATDSTGRKGRVIVVLVTLTNDSGDRLYAVATGCPEKPCDFFIPKQNASREYPWVTLEQLAGLVEDHPVLGFYRMRVPSLE
jgi:hypothetical protein